MTDAAATYRRYATTHDRLRAEVVAIPDDAEAGMAIHSLMSAAMAVLARADAELRDERDCIRDVIAALDERIRRMK